MQNLKVERIGKWTEIEEDNKFASEIIAYLFSQFLSSNKRIIMVASLIILSTQNCFS